MLQQSHMLRHWASHHWPTRVFSVVLWLKVLWPLLCIFDDMQPHAFTSVCGWAMLALPLVANMGDLGTVRLMRERLGRVAWV